MTTFVITVPGTFVHGISPALRSEVERRLSPRDPQDTDLGETEDLSLLTVEDDGNAFSVRVRIEAPDKAAAESDAVRLVSSAFEDSGLSKDDAPFGPAAVTGIDREF